MLLSALKYMVVISSIVIMTGTSSLAEATEKTVDADIMATPRTNSMLASDVKTLVKLEEVLKREADRKLEMEEKTAKIRTYLEGRNAPLASQAEVIVEAGYLYGIEPEMIAAISVIESGGGKILFRSHNAWGWGSYNWSSWEEAIHSYAQGLYMGYISRGIDTPAEIAPIYCPPNHVYWTANVTNVMNQIKNA